MQVEVGGRRDSAVVSPLPVLAHNGHVRGCVGGSQLPAGPRGCAGVRPRRVRRSASGAAAGSGAVLPRVCLWPALCPVSHSASRLHAWRKTPPCRFVPLSVWSLLAAGGSVPCWGACLWVPLPPSGPGLLRVPAHLSGLAACRQVSGQRKTPLADKGPAPAWRPECTSLSRGPSHSPCRLSDCLRRRDPLAPCDCLSFQ